MRTISRAMEMRSSGTSTPISSGTWRPRRSLSWWRPTLPRPPRAPGPRSYRRGGEKGGGVRARGRARAGGGAGRGGEGDLALSLRLHGDVVLVAGLDLQPGAPVWHELGVAEVPAAGGVGLPGEVGPRRTDELRDPHALGAVDDAGA